MIIKKRKTIGQLEKSKTPVRKGPKKRAKSKKTDKASQLRKQMASRRKKDKIRSKKNNDENKNFLWAPSGCITVDAACSDGIDGAYKTGTMINVIGESGAGKSVLALTGMAKCAQLDRFKDYDLIEDDAEHADSFDHEGMFGEDFANRVQAPNYDSDGEPLHSTTIEEFEVNIHDRLNSGKPFIYLLDSFDAIDSKAETKKTEENIAHRKKGTKESGTYDMSKQKQASRLFRQICAKLKKTKSLLIIVSQTRDNVSPGARQKKIRSGGNALKFYASIEMWIVYTGAINRTVRGNEYRIGGNTEVRISKNKYTGKKRRVNVPIYDRYGVDELTSAISYLVKNKWWKMTKQTISAEDLGLKGTMQKIIKDIEAKNLEPEVYQAVGDCWDFIENELNLDRKPKFK